jgi:DNA-binding transcriptional MocR family regulator
MARGARLWSISSLATELQRNPRTMVRALSETPADGTIKGGHKAWYLTTALATLAAYERSSDQLAVRPLSGGDGKSDASLAQLERLAHDIDAGMRRLRAAAPGQRRQVLEEFGGRIGAFDRALERSIAKQGSDATAALGAFRDRHVGHLVREIAGLLAGA